MLSKERHYIKTVYQFCLQFDAVSIGLLQDSTLGRLGPPFGFAASPAIFSMCAEATHRLRRRMLARDGSMSGRATFISGIFAEDAIFVEEVGDILTETVDGWGGCASGIVWPRQYKWRYISTGWILEYAMTLVGFRPGRGTGEHIAPITEN